MDFLTLLALLVFLAWIGLATAHGAFWQPLLDVPAPTPALWPRVTVIVPARDEAAVLPRTLPALLAQDYPGDWKVILVDDHSVDGTAELALRLAAQWNAQDRFRVIKAPPLPPGWSGKLAAMQAGVAASDSDKILFTDADILHLPSSLRLMVARAEADELDLNSWMVRLNCATRAERWLIPAFVFFFGMLYPFGRANDRTSSVAAAAGGAMLVSRTTLEKRGGLARIRNALIDDCALARLIKGQRVEGLSEGRLRLTLTEHAFSLREYKGFGDVHAMIARTAFTQLRHSNLLLLGTVLGLALLFFVPLAAIVWGSVVAGIFGFATWLLMSALYAPMIAFYRLPIWRALTLPVAAFFYLLATLDSARQSWMGQGGAWKGRTEVP